MTHALTQPAAPARYLRWFDIRTADGIGRAVLGYDARDAADRYESEQNKPIYCRLHDGMPEAQRSAPVGEMGYYTPLPVRAATAQPMREGYSGGGTCVFADGPVVDLTSPEPDPTLCVALRAQFNDLIAGTVPAPTMVPQQAQQQQALAARIPNFSQPVPVRSTSARTGRRQIPLDRRYRNIPDEIQPGTIEAWEAVTPVRPDTAHSRSLRFLDVAGELLAAVAIIGGGMVLTGLASLL